MYLFWSTPTFAQREDVNRQTGEIIHPCHDVSCHDDNKDYQGENLFCLKCKLYTTDSTLKSEYSLLINEVKGKKKIKAIEKSKKKWEYQKDKKAYKASEEYKGGTMENSEFVRVELLETEKRILYLKGYSR